MEKPNPDKPEKSATTSRAGGMRMASGRGPGHLCWWPLIFKKNFFDLCFIGSLRIDDHLTDSSLAVSCLLNCKEIIIKPNHARRTDKRQPAKHCHHRPR
jgi:hypothetical protein